MYFRHNISLDKCLGKVFPIIAVGDLWGKYSALLVHKKKQDLPQLATCFSMHSPFIFLELNLWKILFFFVHF